MQGTVLINNQSWERLASQKSKAGGPLRLKLLLRVPVPSLVWTSWVSNAMALLSYSPAIKRSVIRCGQSCSLLLAVRETLPSLCLRFG